MSEASQGPGWWRASDGRWYPPQPSQRPPTKSRSARAWTRFRSWPTWVQVVLAVGVAIVGIAAIASPDEEPKSSSAARVSTTGAPKTEPTTTLPPSPAEALKAAIKENLKKSNRDGVARLGDVVYEGPGAAVWVTWAINQNITEGLTKDTARRDATEVLEAIRKAGISYSVIVLTGTFELVDQLGNSEESTVVRAEYLRSTVDQINFEGFNFKNAFEIAETAVIHPSFQY